MNVEADGTVWVCFYSSFPIVRIRPGAYRVWAYGVAGGYAIAVRSGQALLFGGYQDRTLARVVALEGAARVTEEARVAGPPGSSFGSAVVRAAGDALYFFDAGRVFVLRDW
jgi:hypothetical protein